MGKGSFQFRPNSRVFVASNKTTACLSARPAGFRLVSKREGEGSRSQECNQREWACRRSRSGTIFLQAFGEKLCMRVCVCV